MITAGNGTYREHNTKQTCLRPHFFKGQCICSHVRKFADTAIAPYVPVLKDANRLSGSVKQHLRPLVTDNIVTEHVHWRVSGLANTSDIPHTGHGEKVWLGCL